MDVDAKNINCTISQAHIKNFESLTTFGDFLAALNGTVVPKNVPII